MIEMGAEVGVMGEGEENVEMEDRGGLEMGGGVVLKVVDGGDLEMVGSEELEMQ